MLTYIILIIFLISAIPLALVINKYTKEEKYLSKFIKYLSFFILILLIVSFFIWKIEVTITILYMLIISLISYLKKK